MNGAVVQLAAAVPTTNTPYTAGDCVGGKILQTPGQRPASGIIRDLKVWDTTNQKAALAFFFWADNPSNSTWTDNAAAVISALDVPNLVAYCQVAAADYTTFDSKAFAQIAMQMSARWLMPRTNNDNAAIPTMWMTIIAIGTPTYGTNSTSLFVKAGLETAHQM